MDDEEGSVQARRQELRARLEALQKRKVLNIGPVLVDHDKKAEAEAKAIASVGGYEVEAQKNEHHRKEKFKDACSLAALILFWLVFALILVLGGLWAYHLITPGKYHFLSLIQLGKIETVLFGGILSAFATHYANNQLR